MLDIPPELLILISIHLDDPDLLALAVTSRSICHSLLPEYLRRRGLTLKDVSSGGLGVTLYGLSGYASLRLWSTVDIFHPPEEMYCSIPSDAQEARRAMGFLMAFLLKPSNSHSLRRVELSLRGSNPLLLISPFIKMQRLLYTLPLTRLCFSGWGSSDYVPPSINLRSGLSYGSHTLTSLSISSDYAFTPGMVRTTIGILHHSPIDTLVIYMVSLKIPQWSTLLGNLNMRFLEDVEFEGDIPRQALLRFLVKHRSLKFIRIRCNALLDRAQPSRSSCQPFLPHLFSLTAPLVVCCDIVERIGNSSGLNSVDVDVKGLHPHDPCFHRLLDMLRHIQVLNHLGLRLLPSTTPQANPNNYDWEGHPAHELKQLRSLSFFRQGRFSPGEVVCSHSLSSSHLLTLHVR